MAETQEIHSERDGPNPASGERQFIPVAGIGASAGGLDAFTQLLSRLPEHSGMAFVLIQHLDPNHDSHLTDLLSKSTPLPVIEVQDGMSIAPDHVYVIPPNANLALSKGVLRLSPRGESRGVHLPIDYFMRSIAQDKHRHAIGVVLSGTGSDGTLGLAEIKAAGGITMAQDQASAKYPAMPMSAVAEGVVDIVLPPGEIALELAGIASHSYFGRAGPDAGAPFPDADGDFARIIALLRSSSGVDFTHYRDSTLKRRILRRMALGRREVLADYIRHLEGNGTELKALYEDILIHVTRFFRDAKVFQALLDAILPRIHESKSPEETIRVWVAGCATGEEAYSLAIALCEFQDGREHRFPIRIFASDISESPSLERARAGAYSESIEQDVSPERLRRFFVKEDGGYRINKAIREMCIFAKHDVTADPPFAKLDLISCRNVLIYLSAPLQRRIIPAFHYALNPGGFLLLGSSETIGNDTDLFSVVDPQLKLYSKKMTATRLPHLAARGVAARVPGKSPPPPRLPSPLDFQQASDRLLLRKFVPPGVLVNRDRDVLQFRGRTSPFLEPPQGEISLNLDKMAQESLALELRNGIRECEKTGAAVLRKDVGIMDGRLLRRVDLEILPIKLPDAAQPCFLILFEEAEDQALLLPPVPPRNRKGPPADEEMALLRLELVAAREYVQTIRERCEAVNEELKSSNEEMESSNEELQSANEELETAKEELQSANEELATMNEELLSRNLELARLIDELKLAQQRLQESGDYARSIVDTVREPLVILDGDLRIHSANLSYYRHFEARPEDTEGRLLHEVGDGRWGYPELLILLRRPAGTPDGFEGLEVIHGPAQSRKTLVLNARRLLHDDGRANLRLLAIEDITDRRRAERDLRILKFLSDQSADHYYLMDRAADFSYVNRSACERLGYSEAELLSMGLYRIEPSCTQDKFSSLFKRSHSSHVPPFETEHAGMDGAPFPVECSVTGVTFEGEDFMLVIARDISERKAAAKALHQSEEKLRQGQRMEAIGKLAGGVAHDFNNLLTAINGYSALCLAEAPAEGDLHDHLEEIHRAGERAASLTRQLLAYSRKQVLTAKVLDLNAVVSSMHNMLSRLIGERYRLTLSLESALGLVTADPGQMEQVLINLVVNARDALPEGGEITLSTGNEETDYPDGLPQPPPDGYVTLSVRDNGTGMDAELLKRIFEPFFTTKGIGKGTGLGLSVVQGIISQSGGHILVESLPGAGTEFKIYLPRESAKPSPAARKDEEGTPSHRGSETVLLVEDEETVRNFTRKVLEMHGYAVLEANNGQNALILDEKHKDTLIHILVTDMVMPGIGGRELAGQFLVSRPEGKVLFMSGYTEDSLFREKGFLDREPHFIQKPFNPADLAKAVREALDSIPQLP